LTSSGSYTNIEKIEGLLQFTIDDTSVPSESEVVTYIQESEAKIVDRALGVHTANPVYIDVPISADVVVEPEYGLIADSFTAASDGLIVPLQSVKHPVITITSLHKNDEDMSGAPVWEALTQWNGTTGNTDFILLKTGTRPLGYALYIYDNIPMTGPSRLKMVYTYGYNVPSDILSDYCTLDVSIRVLLTRMGTNDLTGLARVYGSNLGDSIVTNYEERIAQMRAEMARIEVQHFPSTVEEKAMGVAVM